MTRDISNWFNFLKRTKSMRYSMNMSENYCNNVFICCTVNSFSTAVHSDIIIKVILGSVYDSYGRLWKTGRLSERRKQKCLNFDLKSLLHLVYSNMVLVNPQVAISAIPYPYIKRMSDKYDAWETVISQPMYDNNILLHIIGSRG